MLRFAVLENNAVVAINRGVLDLHEMLVGPGFHAVVFELAEQPVGQSLITRGTGLVAAAGKISENEG